MAYKALKELFQNCPSVVRVETCSVPVAPLPSQQVMKRCGDGDHEVEEPKTFKTSLKERIALLESREKRLTAPRPTWFKGSISLPVPLASNDLTTAEDERKDEEHHPALQLQPCSRRGKKDDTLHPSVGDLRGRGSEKRKYKAATEAAQEELDCLEISHDSAPSSHLRRVKPRRAVSFPAATSGEKRIVHYKEEKDDLEDGQFQETQSLIHALEDEDSRHGLKNEASMIPEEGLLGPEFEPLVLWPPPGEGEGSATQSAEMESVRVPESISSRLLGHQREGIRFLYKLYRDNHGGILGDDMGLGKTIQSIAFLAAVLGKKDFDLRTIATKAGSSQKGACEKVVLIICPTSVLQNWDQEIEAWGDFRVGTYFGLQREAVFGRINAKDVEIVLTSHDTFRIHGEELCKIKWDCVIVDEAHRLKNDKSQLYIMCMKLPTKRRYGLTGTVMQNTYMELFNVFEWATPGCLGSRDHFKEYYSGPIKEGQRISAPRRFQLIAEDRQKHLLLVLRKYFLRRTKQQTIAHLMHGKEDNVIFCSVTPVQKSVYKRLLQSPDYQALIGKALPCSCGSPLKRGQCCHRTVPEGVIWPYLHKDSPDDGCDYCPNCIILPCLTKLQQVSNHLELIKPNPKDDELKRGHDYNFAKLALGEDADLVGGIDQETSFLGLSDAQHCGKMLALEKLLSEWITQGDKVLLFSYSTKMLDILDKFLIRKGYCFSRLDGSTPMSLRQSLVEDFNTSPSKQIFLISTRAGGLGLNLVSANRVLIFDPNWNPSHDLQAQDRSFRFGQVRHVTVYRLLAAGSLEELVYTRQIYKQQLFNIGVGGATEKRYFEGVQGSKEHKGELFGIENLLRDVSDKVFAEGIIEDHEERLLRIQQETDLQASQEQDIAHVEEPYVQDEMKGSQGDVTCLHTMEPDLTRSVGGDQDPEDKFATDDHKEWEVQRRVKSALTGAGRGVATRRSFSIYLSLGSSSQLLFMHFRCQCLAGIVYAHRNEEVVNMGSSGLRVSSRRVSSADSPRGLTSKDTGEKQMSRKQHRQRAGSLKIRTPSEVRQEVNGLAGSSTRHPSARSLSKSSKEVFLELAKFKRLSTSQFSSWFVSATKEERAQLRLDYKKSEENVSDGYAVSSLPY